MTLRWTVHADLDRCIGSGTCAFAVPEVFDVDDSGRVVLIGRPEPGDERVREAVENCPTSALTLLEEGSP